VTGTGAEMLQSAAAYYLQGLAVQEAKLIADSLDSEVARAALQGLVGCAGAAAQNQSCGAGASGAAAGVVLTNLVQALDGREASKLTATEREALSNLLSTLVAGITEAAGGETAVTTAAAKIEIENNALFVPVIMGAVWLVDKGLTAYDVYQDIQAIKSGEKTLEQVAQERGEDYVIGVLVGNLAKQGFKAVKQGGAWVAEKATKGGNATNTASVTKNATGSQTHHICTDKNCVSSATGGPWTPRFEEMFEKAGMDLQHELNKISVPGHVGPHPQAYHQMVFDKLESATRGLDGPAYRDALQAELRNLGREIQTPGSTLNKLVTGGKL